jgi:hypothetical protein
VAIIIREADTERELDRIRFTFNENREIAEPIERFQWLYHENPDGPARAWFAIDDRDGRLAGLATVLPRRVRLGPRERDVIAWNAADFSINRPYRTLGVALALRAAARRAIDAGECPFLFSHPNDRMLPVQMRAGGTAIGRMQRFVKPLRAGRGGRVARLALRLFGIDWIAGCRADVGPMDEAGVSSQLDDLFARAAPRLGTLLVRDGRYLDWRFRRCPTKRFELIASRRNGALTGYAAFTVKDETLHVWDWLATGGEAWYGLFAGVVREAVRREARGISVIALHTHPDLARLRRCGFLPRPDFSTAVTYAPESWAWRSDVVNGQTWYMTSGDRHG